MYAAYPKSISKFNCGPGTLHQISTFPSGNKLLADLFYGLNKAIKKLNKSIWFHRIHKDNMLSPNNSKFPVHLELISLS